MTAAALLTKFQVDSQSVILNAERTGSGTLPKPQQMDVRAHLDALLGYVIEKLHEEVTDP